MGAGTSEEVPGPSGPRKGLSLRVILPPRHCLAEFDTGWGLAGSTKMGVQALEIELAWRNHWIEPSATAVQW